MTFVRLSQCACAGRCKHHKGRCEELVEGLYCKCCAKIRQRFRAVNEPKAVVLEEEVANGRRDDASEGKGVCGRGDLRRGGADRGRVHDAG